MKDDSAAQRHFPVRCPACGEPQGYPIAVQTIKSRPGHIRIDICCHACKDRWSQEVNAERD